LPPQGLSLRWFEQFARRRSGSRDDPLLRHRFRDGRDHTRCRSLAASELRAPRPARRRGVLLFLAPMMIPRSDRIGLFFVFAGCRWWRPISHHHRPTVIAMPIVFVICCNVQGARLEP